MTFVASGNEGSAAAQTSGFTIQVFDYTSRWQDHVETGVQGWDAALAYRGIRLQYVRRDPVSCEALNQPAYGISVCDFAGQGPDGWVSDGEHQGIWATEQGIELRGLVRFYRAAPSSPYADGLVCHEIGHTLQLSHAAYGTDSCMTPIPSRPSPSTEDASNALSYIPALPSVQPPQNGDHAKHDNKSKKGKKGKKGKKK